MATDASFTRRRVSLAAGALAVLAGIWLSIASPFITDVSCNWLVSAVLLVSWISLACLAIGFVPVYFSLAPPRPRSWIPVHCWLAAVAFLALGLISAVTDLGLILRVKVSEPWLNEYVAQVEAGTSERHEPSRRVGLIFVDETFERQGVILLYSCDCGFLNRCGVAYVPQGARLPGRIGLLRNLSGRWYSFEWRF